MPPYLLLSFKPQQRGADLREPRLLHHETAAPGLREKCGVYILLRNSRFDLTSFASG